MTDEELKIYSDDGMLRIHFSESFQKSLLDEANDNSERKAISAAFGDLQNFSGFYIANRNNRKLTKKRRRQVLEHLKKNSDKSLELISQLDSFGKFLLNLEDLNAVITTLKDLSVACAAATVTETKSGPDSNSTLDICAGCCYRSLAEVGVSRQTTEVVVKKLLEAWDAPEEYDIDRAIQVYKGGLKQPQQPELAKLLIELEEEARLMRQLADYLEVSPDIRA